MHIREYRNIFKNEETHFFYVSNHQIILSLIKKYSPKKRSLKILDVGCGTGLLTKKLTSFGEVIGIDISDEALKYAKKRGVRLKKASVNKLPFKSGSFELVVCIDVINHQDVDSEKALRQMYRVLKKGGLLVIRSQANRWLRLNHDKHVKLKERYDKGQLLRKLERAGFKIIKLSYTNLLLLPLAALRSLLDQLNKGKKIKSGVGRLPKPINQLLILSLIWEASVLDRFDLPFGQALIAVCKKP